VRASSAPTLDLIEALSPHAERSFEPVFADARSGEIERSCLDVTRARQELGWSSQVDLAEGLGLTVRWAQAGRVAIGLAG
jgi:UDP-glucose 4-epimerase